MSYRTVTIIVAFLCALVTEVLCQVEPNELRGTFRLVGGPRDCPSSIRTTNVRSISSRDTVEIDVSAISMNGNRCRGNGYLIMARQDGRVLSTSVRRRGGGGGGGGGGRPSGGGSRPSGGGSRPSGSRPTGGSRPPATRPIRGAGGSISRPRPGSISRPSFSRPKPPKGTRLGSGGSKGVKWLGAAFLASRVGSWRGGKGSKWRKRRKSVNGDEEDDVSQLSEELENAGIDHYYGFHAVPSLAELARDLQNYTQWGFQCGSYGAEFRTRFLYFKMTNNPRIVNDPDFGFFTVGGNYLVMSGSTFEDENSAFPEIPCIYFSDEHSDASHGTSLSSTASQPIDCLAADAPVTMHDGKVIRADMLHEGDIVERGNQVFMFTHRDAKRVAPFIRFTSADKDVLELTAGHYLYVNGELRPARDVRIGDLLRRADETVVRVVNIEELLKTGVYNPQTVQGDIVVSGFVVSTYTEAITPDVAHSALSPLRAVWRSVGWSSRALYSGMPQWLQRPTWA